MHDSKDTAPELAAKAHLGRSAAGYAVALAEACGARRLVPFHRDPARTDDELDALLAGLRGPGRPPLEGVVEGQWYYLPGARPVRRVS